MEKIRRKVGTDPTLQATPGQTLQHYGYMQHKEKESKTPQNSEGHDFTSQTGGAELEVAIPQRVALESIHLPQRAGAGSSRRRPPPEEEAVLLRLPASGRELYLHLRRDLHFLARGFAVEEAGEAGARGRPPPEQLCFYTGRVLNRSDSFAALSTCAGLIGYIQIGTEQLLIQPVNISETSFSGREHFIRHKRSSKPSYPARPPAPNEHCKVLSGELEKRHERSIA
ncbi:A disintegrin and metalloproteinase with thrombospondin motifs 17-like [Carettochelys insculpta]|uniref:A disintegrin and metalloproteinase with thrombospondin motifs 17-like n=1 Tax=Carettochelys insculpta TaxID=44489 RepID=UPI003EB73CCE